MCAQARQNFPEGQVHFCYHSGGLRVHLFLRSGVLLLGIFRVWHLSVVPLSLLRGQTHFLTNAGQPAPAPAQGEPAFALVMPAFLFCIPCICPGGKLPSHWLASCMVERCRGDRERRRPTLPGSLPRKAQMEGPSGWNKRKSERREHAFLSFSTKTQEVQRES